MTLQERLKKLLQESGVSKADQNLWLERIIALPFSRAEIFVYILENLDKNDIAYFNRNLKEKIKAWNTGDQELLQKILTEEKNYLFQ